MATMVEPPIISKDKDADGKKEDNIIKCKSQIGDDDGMYTAEKDDPANKEMEHSSDEGKTKIIQCRVKNDTDGNDNDSIELVDKFNENVLELPTFSKKVTEENMVKNDSSEQETTKETESRIRIIHIDNNESLSDKFYENNDLKKGMQNVQTEKDGSQYDSYIDDSGSLEGIDSVNSSEINSNEKSKLDRAAANNTKSENDKGSIRGKSNSKRYSHFLDSDSEDEKTFLSLLQEKKSDKHLEDSDSRESVNTDLFAKKVKENYSELKETNKKTGQIRMIDSDDDSESLVEKLYENGELKNKAQTEKNDSQQNSSTDNSKGLGGISIVNNSEIKSDEQSKLDKAASDNTKSENVEDNLRRKSNPKRYSYIIDSDSEDERTVSSSLQKKKIDTNSDDSDSRGSDNSDLLNSKKTKKTRRAVYSDSEDNDAVEVGASSNHGNEKDKRAKKSNKRKRKTIINHDSDEDSKLSNSEMGSIDKSGTTKKMSDLLDSESEDDGRVTPNYDSPTKQEVSGKSMGNKKEKGEKKRTGSIRAAKDEAMRQIHSETQRLLRESEVSLPYHRPKQRSLQEFLNRSKTVPKLPVALTAAARVKMSTEIVSKVLEEKVKEAELFYKSSSDSESEGPNTEKLSAETPCDIEIKNNPISISTNIKRICIEETQKLSKNDVQNAHNKKEIIKQGVKDLGVPRKLFDHDEDESDQREINRRSEEDESAVNPMKKNREYKEGLKDVSVPRQLFGTDFDQQMDIDLLLPDLPKQQKQRSSEFEENKAQSANIGKLIESLEDKANDKNDKKRNSEQMDCSTENDTEDFVLKMSEDPFDCMESLEMTSEQANPKVINPSEIDKHEYDSITETPFIGKEEIAQLNDKNKRDTESKSRKLNSEDETVSDPGIAVPSEKVTSNKLKELDKDLNEAEITSDAAAPIGDVLGLPLPEFDDELTVKPKSTRKRIFPKLMNIKPMLTGSPDMVIDLSESVKPNRSGVNGLMDRFFKHSVTKNKAETKTDVTVIHTEQTSEGLKVVKEVIPYKLPMDEKNDDPELSKPGAKLVRLREELQQKMASKRIEEWKQKEREWKILEEDMHGDGASDGEMEDEEEEEVEEELSDSAESEPEEDDMPIKETKKTTKSPFVDEEAEESDLQEEEDGEKNEDEGEKKSSSNKEESEEDETDSDREKDESDQDGNDDEESLSEMPVKLKRIVKAFEDDSNDAGMKPSEDDVNQNNKSTLQRTRTDVDMFETDKSNDAWSSDTEADLPVYQPRNSQADGRSQVCKTPLTMANTFSFVSPVTQLTALNTSLGSARKDIASNMDYSPLITASLSIENTPAEKKSPIVRYSEKRVGLQKKLFDDPVDMPNDEELMALCSGQFTGVESDDRGLAGLIGPSKEVDDPEAELLGLCSGAFDTQHSDIEKLEDSDTQVRKDDSGDIRLALEDDDQCDLGSATQKHSQVNPLPALKIASSSSEDEEEDAQGSGAGKKKILKKKVRRLELSDEEGSGGEDLSDVDDELEEENDEQNFVDYDSEENEVVVVPNKDLKKVAAKFLEAEAELSESEWGSADEDEKDLDKLDWEEGDDDDIDEGQMKDQLDKIHMRQVLDEDQRDVRMLQEMLFEDGDLHSDGAGRQKQFKWKNIDKLGEDGVNPEPLDDDDASVDLNDESELEWRKLRHEREKFLEEQKKEKSPTDNIEADLEDSQIFKLGMKALKKSKHNQTQSQDISSKTVMPVLRRTVSDLPESPATAKKSFTLVNALQRGSFLARGEEALARLAAMTKQNDKVGILGPKISRNFVFTHLSPATEAVAGDNEEVETQQNAQNNMSRKRKPTSGATPTTVKKFKTDGDRNKGKKLF